MNICFVNWAPFKDSRAGGVSVYNNNVISSLRENTEHRIFTLSCGVDYNLLKKKIYFVRKGDDFSIINSANVAPSHASFSSETQLFDPITENVFCDAFKNMEMLDIIHFNNFEGMPINTLNKIKKALPNVKLVFSAHNYYTLCPQVNLWYQEKENCNNNLKGKKCINCLVYESKENATKKAYFLHNFLSNLHLKANTPFYNKMWIIATKTHGYLYKLTRLRKTEVNEDNGLNFSKNLPFFEKRRDYFKNCVNDNIDIVLGVSDKVTEIYKKFGYQKVVTSYIGTTNKYKKINDELLSTSKKINSIGYMGYMRRDKGFYFFMETLKQMDRDIAENLNLIIAAKNTDHEMLWHIKSLTKKFKSVEYFDGYNKNNLSKIIAKIDVGIIPSQWEDNLPQVAIEYHSQNTPIISSELGGASELNNHNPDFMFNHKSKKDLIMKIKSLVLNGYDEKRYWNNIQTIEDIKNHSEHLMSIYK